VRGVSDTGFSPCRCRSVCGSVPIRGERSREAVEPLGTDKRLPCVILPAELKGNPNHRTAWRRPGMSLFWRLFVPNAVVIATITALLALTPAAVPSPRDPLSAAIVLGGLASLLLLNLTLMRRAFVPLSRLSRLAQSVNEMQPGDRVPVYGGDVEVVQMTDALNAMLARLDEEQRTSIGRAIAAQEDERRRVARELHDEIGQALTAVLLELGHLAKQVPPELADEVIATREGARASLESVRQVARQLRPEALDDLGLVSALRSLADRFSDRGGPRVVPRLERRPLPLDAGAELAVYRVAQEALTNAARHAGASEVELRLENHPGGVRLTVRDNGQGIDGSATEGGGWRGMRERALLVGGSVEICRNEPNGVEVVLDVPSGARSSVSGGTE
jgi:two-component system sensor histidine kinase UhpB